MPPMLSVVPDADEADVADHLKQGDVIDLQTLESESPFCGVTLVRWTSQFLILSPELTRARGLYGPYPLMVPWHAVAWLRLGTDEASFTDPKDDPPNSDEYGKPLRDGLGNLIDHNGDPL